VELLVASAVGLMTAVGVYLILQQRTFPIIIGPLLSPMPTFTPIPFLKRLS
jgi:multisubunit Na+/H+ antiporter MnhC subunit